MASPAEWPSTLPIKPLNDYEPSLPNNTIRADMELGPAKTRRRSSAQPKQAKVSYLLRRDAVIDGVVTDQKAVFEAFYEIVDCHMSFWLPEPEKRETDILVRILGASEDKGLTMQFESSMLYILTLDLEIHPLVPPRPRNG